jgi:hypothetical protein
MNKITPHLIRDLHATLPEGTECYLRADARGALAKHRKNREPSVFLDRNQALPILANRLGRGLKRFFIDDVQAALRSYQGIKSNKMA